MIYTKKIALATIILFTTSGVALAATGTQVTSSATQTVVKASLEVKNAPKLVSKTNNSITLEWEKVDAAATYIVKYSKDSVAASSLPNPQYDNEADPVTTTGSTINKLDPDTNYYFSIVAVDKDNNESDTYSDELKVKTNAGVSISGTGVSSTGGAISPTNPSATGAIGSTGTNSINPSTINLALTNVIAQDNKTITLEFSTPLSSEPVTLKIVKTSDNSDVPVSNIKPDPAYPTKVIATIATMLDPKSSYTVTIIKAADNSGNNIKQGIDGIKEFLTPDSLPNSLQSAPINTASLSGSSSTGSNVNSGNLSSSGSGLSNEQKANMTVPKTGTRENLIVIVALILSFGIMYTYRKKNS